MTQEPKKVLDARQEARRRRRRKRRIIQTSIILSLVVVLAVVGFFVVKWVIDVQKSQKGETTSFLGVKSIQVEGDTRYSAEELIEESGLYVGQGLLAVNKAQANKNLLAAFPYLSTVEVGNSSFYDLYIRVEETPVMAAVQLGEEWMIVGENNHALERLPADALPEGTLKILGATLEGETLGEALLDERSLRICETLIQAAKQYGLTTMTAIDISKKTNIAIQVGDDLEVVLGNETNLAVQMQALVATLPTLYENNGEDAEGRLDMTSYSDDNPDNDKSIYTPAELLLPEENTNATTDLDTAGDSTQSTDGEATDPTDTTEPTET